MTARTGLPRRPYPQRAVRPLEERIFEKVDADGCCWLWTGAKNIGGYGAVSLGRRDGAAIVHRLVWKLLVGPIPEGMELDHLCRVRECCNPDHLQPVTRAVNVARGAQRAGIHRRAACINGHPFTPDNTITTLRGTHTCRTCRCLANRRYRARKKQRP